MLRFDRLRHFPENGKTATVFIGALLGFLLTVIDVHYDAETRFFWSTLVISLLFDVITILILLTEWDENVEWLRTGPYLLYHTLTSLSVGFFNFVAGIMFLISESYSGQGVLFLGAVFCLSIFAIRCACVLKTLPQLKQELLFPGRPSNAEYDNDGTSIV